MASRWKCLLSILGKVDVHSLLSGSREGDSSHTHRLHPHAVTLDAVTSLLVSVVTTVSKLTTCPSTNARLTNLGLNSFDIVRIANQAEAELGTCFGSHDSHMTKLVQKLLDDDIASAAVYIYEEISSRKTQREGEGDSRGRKRSFQPKPDIQQAGKRSRRSIGSPGGSHACHMRVESWRRGQYFVNGK